MRASRGCTSHRMVPEFKEARSVDVVREPARRENMLGIDTDLQIKEQGYAEPVNDIETAAVGI